MNTRLSQFETKLDTAPSFRTYVTEALHPSSPGAWKFTEAKKKELSGLIESNTLDILYRE